MWPPHDVPLQTHLENLATSELSLVGFEESVIDFLRRLLITQPLPVLVQIERGKVEGISVKDGQRLIEDVHRRFPG